MFLVDLPANFAVWLASDEAKFLDNKLVWAHWDVDELKAVAKDIEGVQNNKFTIDLNGWTTPLPAVAA
jgi:hypothetical protein